jgi:CheY-like chemotaxis protein
MARVLVVEDEPRMCAALRRGLTAHELEVVLAADGPSTLPAARSGLFDVILMGIILPVVSGYRVLERLRAMRDRPRPAACCAGTPNRSSAAGPTRGDARDDRRHRGNLAAAKKPA